MAITILGSTSSGGGGSSTPVVQTLPNNDATIAAGTTVARIPAITSTKFYTLPLASGYANGSTLTILDSAGSLSTSVVANISSATDIINGANPLILSTPYASPVLISNGVDKWTLDIRGVSRGGTGATDAAGARTNLGLGTGNSPTFTALTLGASGNLFGGTNLIEQRNGTSSQAFRVYNTYDTAGAYYDRISFFHAGGQATIATEGFGANAASSHLTLAAGGTTRSIFFQTAGSAKWLFNSAGNFLAQTDNAYDIGASGANRPRNIYAAANTTIGDLATANGALTLQATSLPQLTLNCTTGTNSFNGLNITSGGAARAGFLVNMSSGEVKIGALSSSGYFPTFYSNNAEVMRFTTAGLVGIGTTTPASKLTVTSGDIEVATIASGLILKSPDGTRYRVTVPNGGTVLTITAV